MIMNIGYWICSLPSRSLLARLIVLAAVMLAAYGGVLCVVAGHGDTAGMVAASLAAGVCLASAAAALLISQRLRDPANGLAGMLLPMATRTGVPLLLAMLIRFRGGGLVEAGLRLLSCGILSAGFGGGSADVVALHRAIRAVFRRGGREGAGRSMADSAELIAHVKDTDVFHFPFGVEVPVPQPFEAFGLHLTKFMVLELAVALLMVAIFIPLGRKIAAGRPPRGTVLEPHGADGRVCP